MPVLGSQTVGAVGNGFAAPAGWGANWRAARAAAATTRTEVAIFGDSTTWGSQANYSWVQRLRDLSVAAGYADGGKGVFGQGEGTLVYDSPEVNGISGANGWTWVQDAAITDLIAGEGISSVTSGEAVTVQGRVVGSNGELRIWYVLRAAGSFTVTIDGGAANTVTTTSGSQAPAMARFTGLAAGTHTAVITNQASTNQIIAPAFMNATGIVYNKYARVGQTMYHYFDPLGRHNGSRGGRDMYAQSLLGLQTGSAGTNSAWQKALSVTAGRPAVSLGVLDLGFNDFGSSPTPWSKDIAYGINGYSQYAGVTYKAIAASTNVAPPADAAKWSVVESSTDIDAVQEGIHLFCRLVQAAGGDPVVISGELAMQGTSEAAYTYGGRMAAAIRSTALACGAAWCDFMFPALGRPNLITGQASTNNPHLNKVGYVAQADFLWNNVLSL